MAAAGNFDYATQMFTLCVQGDPGNLLYVQNFLGNLHKKYNNNKKGSKLAGLKGAGIKGTIKKATMQKEWDVVLTQGIEMLKLNPWDTSALTAMAHACEELELEDSQVAFLKGALDANLKDPDVNRRLGRVLRQQGKFDEATMAWNRVLQTIPKDEEALRAIAHISAEKTIHKGGYEDAESTDALRRGGSEEDADGLRPTREQQLQKAIKKDPSDTANYIELAELYAKEERFDETEETYQKALEASGGEVSLRERLEDVQIRRGRRDVAIAEKAARDEKTPENVALFRKMKASLIQKEIEVFHSRCERYPTNLGFKIELADRLEKGGKFNEAIKLYQEARNDVKRRGAVHLALGRCFQQIKQYKLAMTNYEAAIAEIPEREEEQYKVALYHAGVLAMGLKDYAKAEEYLTKLAGLDFSYRDVADRLDKLASLRDDGQSDVEASEG